MQPVLLVFCFLLAKYILQQIESLRSRFLWSGGIHTKKLTLVGWSGVCQLLQKWGILAGTRLCALNRSEIMYTEV